MENHNKDFTIITTENRQILRDILPLSKPLALFIEPTNYCNFRCKPCAHGQERNRNDLKPFVHMEYSLFERLIAELKAWEGPKLSLLRLTALGEPFMHPEIIRMVRLAVESGVAEKVDLFTNGSLLTDPICHELVACGLDAIRVSVYSVLEHRHREVTQSDCDFMRIRQNVAALRRIRDEKGVGKPIIFVKMFDTYGKENETFMDLYGDIADEIGFEKVHDATQYNGSDLIGAYYSDPQDVQRTKEAYHKSLNDHKACSRPFMAMVVCAGGDVVMCTHDAPRATCIGNVKEDTLRDLWNSEALYEFRKMHLTGQKHLNRLCKNCDWFRLFPPEDNVDGLKVELFRPQRKQP